MWCLPTIVALNQERASGKSLAEAYEAVGIKMPCQPMTLDSQTVITPVAEEPSPKAPA
jgi:hypothetical protein